MNPAKRESRPRAQAATASLPTWTAALLAAASLAFAIAFFWEGLRLPLIQSESLGVIFGARSHLRLAELGRWFTPDSFGVVALGRYFPLTWAVYVVIHSFLGIDPLWYKLFKLLVVWGSALALFAAARRLGTSPRWAALAAALYFSRQVASALGGMVVLHDILAAFFCLAALWCHLAASQRPKLSPLWLAAALACYAAALLSKESSVNLPAVLLGTRVLLPAPGVSGAGVPLQTGLESGLPASPDRPLRRLLIEHAPFWAAMLLYLAAMRWWLGFFQRCVPARFDSLGSAGAAASLYARYWVMSLSGGPLLWIVGAGVLLWLWSGRQGAVELGRRGLLAGLWALFALLPALNLYPYLPDLASALSVAEPRYLAFAGAAVAWFACHAMQGLERFRPAGWAASVFVAYHALASMHGAARHHTGADFIADLRSRLPRFVAAGNIEPLNTYPVGDALMSLPLMRRFDPHLYRQAVEVLDSELPGRDASELRTFLGEGDWYLKDDGALLVAELLRTASFKGFMTRLRAHRAFERGRAWLGRGESRRALAAFEEAWAMDPTHADACRAAAGIHEEGGDEAQADAWLARCPGGRGPQDRIPPENLIRDRAERLALEGRYAEAQAAYEEYLRKVPVLWPGRREAALELKVLASGARQAYDRAMAAFRRGDLRTAARGFEEALAKCPDYPDALASRGALRGAQGRWGRAAADYGRALKAKNLPPSLRRLILDNRANAFLRLGRRKEAAADIEESLRLAPEGRARP
ncbi:MAG: hypothetical protein HY748_03650 [Elusimicrobia bacterium]|nr:hypothetical protein [Elusimicrobiota bacterium]